MPQVLATYAASCWGVLQFVDWLTDRYQLSPALTDFWAYLGVLAAPSVLILAYFRGEPGRTPWSRWEKFGIPLNALVAALVLFVVFRGQELGSVNELVIVRDSEGRTVQRLVPKRAFRKRLVLFPLRPVEGTADDDVELGRAVANLLAADLSQEPYIDLFDIYDIGDRLKTLGFGLRDRLTLGVARQVAEYYHLDQLLTGSVVHRGDRWSVTFVLYERTHLKRQFKKTYEGPDLFDLIDDASLDVRLALGIPQTHIDDTLDYPAAEIMTDVPVALAAYTRGLDEFNGDSRYAEAERWFARAIALDPTFARAHALLAYSRFNMGRYSEASPSLQQARKYAYKLSDKERFRIAIRTALIEGNSAQQENVLRQWAALYPDDLDALRELAAFYRRGGRISGAIAAYERILDLNPEQPELLIEIGDLYLQQGRTTEALERYRAYEAQQPGNASGAVQIGTAQLLLGNLTAARAAFERALAIDRNDIEARIGLMEIAGRTGEAQELAVRFREALSLSRSVTETSRMHQRMHDYYRAFGRPRDAYREARRSIEVFSASINNQVLTAFYLEAAVLAGETTAADETLARLKAGARSKSLSAAFASFGAAKLALARGQSRVALEAVLRTEKTLHTLGFEALLSDLEIIHLRGRAEAQGGDCRRAVASFREALALDHRSQFIRLDLGRCLQTLGAYTDAEAELRALLTQYPAYPEIHLELARVLLVQGKRAAARTEAQQAVRFFKDAEPDYRPAREAHDLAAQLR